jgi:hypothetical protein
MSDGEKVLTYEEAKQLCMKAFDGGALYGSESMRYGVNARAYDWEHWLQKNESLFMPKPTVEDVLQEFVSEFNRDDTELCDEEIIERFAAKLRLAGDAE